MTKLPPSLEANPKMNTVIRSHHAIVSLARRRQPLCCIQSQQQERLFASRRKTPPKKKKKNPPQARHGAKRQLPAGVFLPEGADSVPPAYLSATASPHVYVATCAVQEADIDPKSLFCVDEPLPHVHADYVSPKDFKHSLPKWNIPEVTFLGRSNCGKSSLINALLQKKDLARSSKQPGRTQQVNYFGMFPSLPYTSPAEAAGFLVDLPGYGYAKAPPEHVKAWQENTQAFLLNRRDASLLKRLFLLVDSRRGTSQMDRDIMGWLDEADIAYSVVLTKSDRSSRPQIVRFANDVCMRHHSQTYGETGGGSQGPVVHVTSARDGLGISELMTSIHAEFVGHRQEQAAMQGGGGDSEGWSPEYEFVDDEDGQDGIPLDPDDVTR